MARAFLARLPRCAWALSMAMPLASACSESTGSSDGDSGFVDASPSDVALSERARSDASDDDPDGPCACTLGGANGRYFGVVSLACICRSGCPTYDELFHAPCPPRGDTFSRIYEYGECNRVSLGSGNGLGGGSYTFDATTHELVSAGFYTDTLDYPCAGHRVGFISGGAALTDDCVVTSERLRCPDALDGAVRDVGRRDAPLDQSSSSSG